MDRQSNEYFAIDIETTSLNPRFNDIVEVYYAYIKDGKIVEESHSLHWSILLFKTQKIHQIKYKEIFGKEKFKGSKEAKRIREFLERVIDKDDPLVLMAHYAPFEIKWLENKLKIDLSQAKVYDTCEMERIINPGESASLINSCLRRGIVSPNKNYDFHRADQDVKAMLELFSFQQKELKELNNDIKKELEYE